MNAVVVTGLGILSAAGRGPAMTSEALRLGRHGPKQLTRFESPRNGHLPVAEVAQLSATPRTLALARDALDQAIQQAGLSATDLATAGLALGTCVAGMPETEDALRACQRGGHLDDTVLGRHECGYLSDQLARDHGIRGPVTTLSTACSSSAQAIATASDLLAAGACDLVLAGGADALCRLTLNGFASLLNVSASGCQPFDIQRSGMSLGEGAAFLVLERKSHAEARGATPLAKLLGHGNSCDAHHATAPHPDGLGAEAAMRAALAMAELQPGDVDYINAHGTGTVENDAAEGRALQRMFGDTKPAISSTKRVFGHTLGAAGAIEAVVAILAMREGFLPGTLGLEQVDPACRIEPLRETCAGTPQIVLSNSFGFGGNNSSLCFGAVAAGS